MKKIAIFLTLAIAWLFISTFLLTIPGSSFPKQNWLDKVWIDKWVHIAMFAIMVWLWCGAMPADRKIDKVFIIVAIISFIYGIGMEFVQRYFVANRSFDVGDIVADGLGAAAGLIYSTKRYIKK